MFAYDFIQMFLKLFSFDGTIRHIKLGTDGRKLEEKRAVAEDSDRPFADEGAVKLYKGRIRCERQIQCEGRIRREGQIRGKIRIAALMAAICMLAAGCGAGGAVQENSISSETEQQAEASERAAAPGETGGQADHETETDIQPELVTAESLKLGDGIYTAEVVLEGGSGRAGIKTPARLRVENGAVYAEIVWSSANYDYMKVNDEIYQWSGEGEYSSFEIPVAGFDQKLPVIADTTAMSVPHEIEYTLIFDSESLKREE